MKKLPLILLVVYLGISSFKHRIMSIFEDTEYIAQLRADYGSGDYSRWEKPHLDSISAVDFQDIGLLPKVPFPEDNPFTEEKRELGKMLFFDPRLSSSQQISCASCHDSDLAWADGRTVSFGHNRKAGKRNAMSLINVGYNTVFFWDGRATTLEEQIHFPLTDTVEMHSSAKIAVKNIRKIKGYKPFFKKAFGDEAVTIERMEQAIATFERSITSGKSKFDRFISGDAKRFTDEEVVGLHLFRTKARCINCHNTPLFSDQKFRNVGLSYYGRKFQDLGKFNLTGKAEDVGSFKTPSLREVGRTSPYMHNGLFPELENIIQLYDAGMPRPQRNKDQENDPLFPTTDPQLKPLQLTKEEKAALKAFLLTLSSPAFRERPPELPEK